MAKRHIIEWEIKVEGSGTRLTDREAMVSYIEFGRGVVRFAQKFTGSTDDFGLRPTLGKLAITFEHLPQCQPGGHLRDSYLLGLNR